MLRDRPAQTLSRYCDRRHPAHLVKEVVLLWVREQVRWLPALVHWLEKRGDLRKDIELKQSRDELAWAVCSLRAAGRLR